jgi:heat shock protein HtpX
MNSLKTTMLLGLLTCLLVLAGGAIGGRSGMTVALLMAGVMNFVSYWFSDKIVLAMYGAKEVSETDYPDFYGTVRQIAIQGGIPMPKVYLMESDTPNAFATGRNPEHAAVAATTGILRILSREELLGVMAHELSHVKNRDVLTLTVASFIAMIAAIVMQNFLFAGMFSRRSDGGNPWIIAGIVAIIVYFVSQLLIMALSRYREFAADRGSAYITGRPQDLISALTKISGRMQYVPPEAKAQVEGANAFFIIPALSGRSMIELFSTHPPLEKRIAALEQVGAELQGA